MSKLNVLVVDDAPFIRDLIKKGLRNLFPGLTVDEAAMVAAPRRCSASSASTSSSATGKCPA